MSLSIPRSFILVAIASIAVLSGCGGSSGATLVPPPAATAPPAATVAVTPPPAAVATPTTAAVVATPAPALPTPAPTIAKPVETTAAVTCPPAATVDAALGTTLPEPVGVKGGSGTLPPGATAIVCEYHAASYNVIIELLSNVPASYMAYFVAKFPVAGTSVPGLGDQAQAFSTSLGAGKNNQGVVASQGSSIVDITATDTPASLAQIEALVGSLL